MADESQSLFDAIGGDPTIEAITRHFYDEMERTESVLAALHPPFDGRVPAEAREHFRQFLRFWTGGPKDYLTLRGHPRLGMRHARVPIDPAMRDAWVRCMTVALDACHVTGEPRQYLDDRFKHVAHFLQNLE